jgi:anti-sigma factor RsiW
VSDARCGEFRELVSAYVDERLDAGELLRLEEHFLSCVGCRAFAGELRRFKELLPAAEAFRPLRRPPPGFAALVAARVAREPRAQVVPFPEVRPVPRRRRAPRVGMVAAAAAAALFFAWSWQRLLPGYVPTQRQASRQIVLTGSLAEPPDGGSMDTWMREHTMLARSGTLLGPAEEIEFARFHSGVVPER